MNEQQGCAQSSADIARAYLYFARLLGPRPNGVAAQQLAIRAAAEHVLERAEIRDAQLISLPNEADAAVLTYSAAIDYLAHDAAGSHRRGRPSDTDYSKAYRLLRKVIASGDEVQVKDYARGGLWLLAFSIWERGAARVGSVSPTTPTAA
ncbi:MAG: hypothetical protein H6Q36_1837 [Chloroflexi bacterium]|nr:hypothetical protein [Chloroflexota bacterium]